MKRVFSILVSVLVTLCVVCEAFSGMNPLESLLPESVHSGWLMRDPPETFTGETLFEHINGEADLFVQYGFNRSVFAVYRRENWPDDRIDVDIYDMGNSLQAFGVFSRFRQKDSPAGIGTESCFLDRYALFCKGKYFVILKVVGSNDSILKTLGKEIATRINDNSPLPLEIGYFPREGIIPGSIEYFPDGLLGYEFLQRGFKANYESDIGPIRDGASESAKSGFNLFLSIYDDQQAASRAMELFREYLIKNGSPDNVISVRNGPDKLNGIDPYQGNVLVVQHGQFVVGAVGFDQATAPIVKIEGLINNLK